MKKIDVQMAPPHMRRRNLSERSICTFKEHLKSLQAACDTKFPNHLCCRLIPQSNITLNLLRQTRLHTQISAYHPMWGAFDYNQTPLAPNGTRFLVHENPK